MRHRFDTEAFYEDTDQSGLVYHANYLKFIERGRSAFVRDLGIDQREMLAEGLAFAVRAMEIEYLRPARFGDGLTVTTSVVGPGPARLVLDQAVLRGEETLFTARVTIVCVRLDGRPARLPSVLRDALATA